MGVDTPLRTLDENGFVFIDAKDMPYWIAMRYGKPMMAYWHEGQKSWVNLRQVTQTEIWQMNENAISDELAEIYHTQHRKSML